MLRLLTAGESHGRELTVIVDGLPAGVEVDGAAIDHQLRRRQGGYGRGARSTRVEQDHAAILSGVARGRTTGAPVALRIENRDFQNQPADPPPLTTPRPGHADLAGALKFGHLDLRLVRERASARETAARVAAGGLLRPLLSSFGAQVCSFVTAIGEVELPLELGRLGVGELMALAARAEADACRCPDPDTSTRMREVVDARRTGRETAGGQFVVAALGVPPGLGSYTEWDRRLDGRVAQALCSIPAVKGVEIGPAFAVSGLPGSRAQDPISSEGGALVRTSNFAGGLEGGVSNGQPIVLRAAMKPLSSVRAELASVDLLTGAAAGPPYVRSDVCAVPAAAVVGEAMLTLVLSEALLERFGGDRLDLALGAQRSLSEATGPH